MIEIDLFKNLVLPFSTFVIGFALGYVIRGIRESTENDGVKAFISYAAVTMWVISVLADVVLVEYSTPMAIHALVGLIAGSFYEGTMKWPFGGGPSDKK